MYTKNKGEDNNMTFERNEIFKYIRGHRRGKVVKVGVFVISRVPTLEIIEHSDK